MMDPHQVNMYHDKHVAPQIMEHLPVNILEQILKFGPCLSE